MPRPMIEGGIGGCSHRAGKEARDGDVFATAPVCS